MAAAVFSCIRTSLQVSLSMGGGDVVCQLILNDGNTAQLDWQRTKRMAMTGYFVQGPWTHGQYALLERMAPGTAAVSVAKKVLATAMLAPIGISLTFMSVYQLQGKVFYR